MTQATNQKNLIEQAIEYVKNNSKMLIVLGLTVTGFGVGLKLLSKRVHPDTIKVLQLRRTIQKSYHDAQKVLENLNVEKRIFTQYGNQGDKSADSRQQLNMLYLLITRLKIKQSNKQKQLRNPFLPPFEDVDYFSIFQGLFITELQPTHRLLYNKFNIFKNHLLVVTKEFEAQTNELNEMDFKQSILVMKALNGLMFYNSGSQAGSSQPHKHIQVFPIESHQLPIVQKITEFVKIRSQSYDFSTQPVIEFPGFNFVHGLVLLKPEVVLSVSRKQMYNAYKRLLQVAVKRIQAKGYNLIATDQFILIVARLKQKAFKEISVNAVGFMGSMLFKDEQKLNRYLSLKIKPSSILEDITYPKDYIVKADNPIQGKEE